MKTGIVFEVKGRKAVVMKNGGEFVEVRAEAGWQKGDVVTLKNKSRNFKALYAAAACFVFLILASFGGYRLYFTETSLISMDINPSLELSINRFGKVISVTTYNEDAAGLIDAQDTQGLSYQQAIDSLLESDALRPYLESKEYLEFAVYSKSDDTVVIEYLNSCVQSINDMYPEIQVKCNSADGTIVANAHSYHMSIGKYLAILDLQEIDPEIDVDDYSHCEIGEIRNQIRRRHQYGNGQDQHDQEDESESGNHPYNSSSTQGSGNGYQYHDGDSSHGNN